MGSVLKKSRGTRGMAPVAGPPSVAEASLSLMAPPLVTAAVKEGPVTSVAGVMEKAEGVDLKWTVLLLKLFRSPSAATTTKKSQKVSIATAFGKLLRSGKRCTLCT